MKKLAAMTILLAVAAAGCSTMSSPYDSYAGLGLPHSPRNLAKAVDPSWHQEGQNPFPGYLAYNQVAKAGEMYQSGDKEAARFVGDKVIELEKLRSDTASNGYGGYGYGGYALGGCGGSGYSTTRLSQNGMIVNRDSYTHWVTVDGRGRPTEVPAQGFRYLTLPPGKHTFDVRNANGNSTTGTLDIDEVQDDTFVWLPKGGQQVTTDWAFTIYQP